ncbi:MAG: BBP7 family outer membrane beta-barrel protein [Planctomycetes bacterium]|nr:BBP7 family outer membrane beta-barrel protein [Planctomycetota bacterium]
MAMPLVPCLFLMALGPVGQSAGESSGGFAPVAMPSSIFGSDWNAYGTKPVSGFTKGLSTETVQSPPNPGSDRFPGSGAWWIESDFVFAWIRGAKTPPLLAAVSAGDPANPLAIPGLPGTVILAGGDLSNDGMRPGLRIGTGCWLNEERTIGLQGSFLMVGSGAQTVTAGGNPSNTPFVLSRPVVDVATGASAAIPVNFPGLVQGGAVVSAKAGYLYGADAVARLNLFQRLGPDGSEAPDRSFRLDGTMGYQFLHYSDGIGIRQSLTPTGGILPGIQSISSYEQFNASNMFNGGTAGLTAEWWTGRWHLQAAGRIGLGGLSRQASVSGESAVTLAGNTVNVPGALLAQPSNTGGYRSCSLAWLPQADFKVDYRLTERVILSAGYTMLVLPEVWRAAEQIDPVVNLAQTGGIPRPVFPDTRSALWMQGITLGARLDF